MGLFPCDQGSHRYRGPQQTIYPAIVGGGTSYRRKIRLCPEHFEHMFDMLSARCSRIVNVDDELVVRNCVLCGLPVGSDDLQFFATVYATRSERMDFWAPLHEECSPASREDWLLTSGMA